jgi:hypothetical protein
MDFTEFYDAKYVEVDQALFLGFRTCPVEVKYEQRALPWAERSLFH